ncbi:MAG: cysteine desulfurase NifS [Candidatus Diapherotrites archaeon CG10_big_fil_rev_8_21_14_0_10_31_34]|nr:MAG: cysteine desulfurase NifS [Candidatus Diapherotrites archaeon CG10_big_fil_rev_8_21_14_0_10_31_34]
MNKKIYFDNAATTKTDEKVLMEMNRVALENYGNASSLHSMGQQALEEMEKARETIGKLLGAKAKEIYFTSGGSESDNFALKGIMNSKNKLITTKIEHPAVLRTAEYLKEKGKNVLFNSVDEKGIIKLDELEKNLDKTDLVSVMHANNEIGSIQPLKEIAELKEKKDFLFHSDMVQTAGKIKINLNKMNLDLASFSGHKFYGPKGTGILYIREGVDLIPLIHGGGQERKKRSGTENIPGIAGIAKALELAEKSREEEMNKQEKMRDKLIKSLSEINKSKLNGHEKLRLANNVNFSFFGVEGESLITLLDFEGIQVSTGSACSSKNLKISHVLEAIGLSHVWAHGSLRISLGKNNSVKEVDFAIKKIPEIVEGLRKISPVKF